MENEFRYIIKDGGWLHELLRWDIEFGQLRPPGRAKNSDRHAYRWVIFVAEQPRDDAKFRNGNLHLSGWIGGENHLARVNTHK